MWGGVIAAVRCSAGNYRRWSLALVPSVTGFESVGVTVGERGSTVGKYPVATLVIFGLSMSAIGVQPAGCDDLSWPHSECGAVQTSAASGAREWSPCAYRLPPREFGDHLRQTKAGRRSLILAQYVQPDLRTDEAVVGRQFPLSPSVQQQCGPPPEPPYSYMCETLMSELRRLAEEAREESWASATEEGLRVGVARDHTATTIRALECRESLCAIEMVTPTVVPGYKGVSHALLAENGLVRVQEVPAWETDKNGVRVVVLAQVFRRKAEARMPDDR